MTETQRALTYKAFVSSTFEDLKAHRAYVIAALRKAGIHVDPMEDWTAATDEPKTFSQDRMQGCDLCVLLVALRRGHVPAGEELSVTQLEYRAARALGMDVLVFMLDEQAPWPRRFDELDKDPAVGEWRRELGEHQGIGFFDNEPDSVEIEPALTRWVASHPREETEQGSATLRSLPARNLTFAGRTTELKDIHTKLTGNKTVGVTQQTALHGFGGIGKTALAIEYGWTHLDDYPGGAYLVGCDVDVLLPVIAALAEPLGIVDDGNPEAVAAEVKRRLETGPPSLLILDNVRDGDQWQQPEWEALLPRGNCCRLITTRAERLAPDLPMQTLSRLSSEDGVSLLAKFRPDATDPTNAPVVGDIVEWFDGLAVGLTVVGAYMVDHPNLSWDAYAASLEEKGLGAVRATQDVVGSPPDYDRRVDTVFDELVDSCAPAVRRCLEYAALLPEDKIYAGWLNQLLADDPEVSLEALPGYEHDPAQAVVDDLQRAQLLRTHSETEQLFGLHRVLRRRLTERLDEEAAERDTRRDAVVALGERRGQLSHDALTDKTLRSELTPLGALVTAIAAWERWTDAASLAGCLTTPLQNLGRHVENRVMLEQFAVPAIAESLEPDELATLYSNLGMVLQDPGDLPAARGYLERAIAIAEEHFEPNHPTFAGLYSNLATILKDLGDLPAARGYLERAIAIDEEHFEPNHPTLATSYSNLGAVLQGLGDPAGARAYLERAIAIEEEHFEPNHPTLATSYSNLGAVLQDLGDLPAARDYLERAIAIEEEHFEPNHPTFAIRYSNLGAVLKDLGDLPAARDYLARAIAIAEEHFEPNHPTRVTLYKNMKGLGG